MGYGAKEGCDGGDERQRGGRQDTKANRTYRAAKSIQTPPD